MGNDAPETETDEQPITRADEDLAAISSRHVPDAFLVDLMRLAEAGGGFGVGLLVNGMIILGALSRAEDIAEAIDAERRAIVSKADKPDDRTEEEWAEDVAHFSTQASRAVANLREHETKLEEDAKPYGGRGALDSAAAPARITRDVIHLDARSHLTLVRAKVFAPGQVGVTQIPVMRVQLTQIAGWWILSTDEQGASNFKLWETDVPGISRD